MPAPQKSMYVQLVKLNFTAKQIKLPVSFSKPNNQFDDAFSILEQIAFPNPPTNLFREATLNKFHVNTAKDIGKAFEDYIDGICGAICSAIQQWMTATAMTGVIINAVVGVVHPGCVVGPPLTPLILASGPKKTPQELKYTTAIASVFGTAWLQWSTALTGQLMYPAFAAVPSPVAPPMPNIPVPLITFASPGEVALQAATMKAQMIGQLGDPQAAHAADLFDALTQGFTPVFNIFKASTMVTNVLGTGPVPTFAPPFVPVGPVIMGVGNSPPGCFV
jgi:uncharacterized membrane protein YeaQ/YmgE (transglycosylase-associated protein family)